MLNLTDDYPHTKRAEEEQAFSIEGLVSWFTRLKKRASANGRGGVHHLRPYHRRALLQEILSAKVRSQIW